MIIKKYHYYLVKLFLKNLLIISLIFSSLTFFLNIFEEIKFFENYETSFYYPLMLTLLNIPSLLFEMFPFIFLITSKFFFIHLYEKDELNILRANGINNLKIINILTITTLVSGILIIFIYYSFSSSLKNTYLNIKNSFSAKSEYLAVVNENGLWLKEESDGEVNIINAAKINDHYLNDVTITKVDTNYNTIYTLVSPKADILNTKWQLKDVQIHFNEVKKNYDDFFYFSFFNSEIISKLFSNLSSLNIFQLNSLIDNYSLLGYSTTETELHLNKIYSLPLYLILMTIIGSVLMFKFKFIKSKIFMVIIGVSASVIVYYLNYFASLFGKNETLPIFISIWLPQIILILICSVNLIRINEK